MAKRSNTRSHIVRMATDLYVDRGFNGFSYQDISGPLGVKNAAIHYHYATKGDLGVAIIDRYREILRKRTGDFMEHGSDPVGQLDAYLGFIRDGYVKDGSICPMGILAADYHTVPEQMRPHAELLVHEMLAWLTRVLEEGRNQGLFFFNGPAGAKAAVVKSCLQGGAQLARISGVKVLDQVIEQVRRDLGLG